MQGVKKSAHQATDFFRIDRLIDDIITTQTTSLLASTRYINC
jgi:hypothetical protein